MFAVGKAPHYVKETCFAAARLQENTTAEQYEALVERAERQLDGMFTVDVDVDPELRVKIVLRERFVAARAKQAILMVATWQLINNLAGAWNVRKAPAVARPATAPAPVRVRALEAVPA